VTGPRIPFEQRFWQKVDASGGASACWPWTAAIDARGYGSFSRGPKKVKAHRAAAILAGMDIPDGMMIDHLCKNRRCVNPAHLRVVTPRQNSVENSDSQGAVNAGKTHCHRGHPFVGANVYVRKNGGRYCRECGAIRSRLWYQTHRIEKIERSKAWNRKRAVK